MKRSLPILLVLCVCLFLFACTGCQPSQSDPTPKPTEATVNDGTLTIGILTDPLSLNPMMTMGDGTTSTWFSLLGYPTLFNSGENASTEPYIATGFDVSEEGKAITFHLRKDLKWSDGTPFTSRDVAYSYHLAGEKGMNIVLSAQLGLVDNVEIPDEHTIVFNLNQSSYTFGNAVGSFMSLVPEHAWSNLEDVAAFLNDENQVVLGPYALKEHKVGEYYIYERWTEDWFDAPDGKVQIKEIVYRIYPDMNSMALALEAGEIDITGKSLSTDLANQLVEKGFSVAKNSSIGFNHVAFNLENEFLANKTLRVAIGNAIDKESVLQFTYKGDGDVMDSIQAPIFAECRSSDPLAKYPTYDLENAKSILQEGGFVDTDGDGIINDPDSGKNVSFRLLVNNSSIALVNGCEVVLSNLKDLGIDVILDSVDHAGYSQKYFGFDFDAAYTQWGTMIATEGHFVTNYDADSPVYFNRVKLNNIQAAVDDMKYASSEDELREAIFSFEIAMADQVIDIPLFTYNTNYLYSDRVNNVIAYPSERLGASTLCSIVRMQLVD